MKVLVLMTSYKWLRSLRSELLDAMRLSGCLVSIAGPFDGAENTLRSRGYDCHHVDVQRRGTSLRSDLRLLMAYRRLVRDILPDLVLTFSIKANIYGAFAASALHIPFITSITGLGSGIQEPGVLRVFLLMMYRRALRKASCVFFQNESNLHLMQVHGIVRESHHTRLVKGSGVNTAYFLPQPYPGDAQGIRFLFVGRLMKEKGIEELLAALSVLAADSQGVTLELLGMVEEESVSKLLEACSTLPLIIHGEQADVRPYLASCHCLVLPSYHEGMANVLLEAAASGRPVIASRIPGCQETFDEGISGIGCNPRDAQSLVVAMRDFVALTQEERRQMGLAGRRKMEREFERNQVVDTYMEEINRIMKERKS